MMIISRNIKMTTLVNRIIIFSFNLLVYSSGCCQSETNENEMIGLWEGKRIAGPEVQGNIIVEFVGDEWLVDVAGYKLTVTNKDVVNKAGISFSLPSNRGSFSGKLDPTSKQIKGHWIQPGTINNGMPHASPLILTPDNDKQWRGEIVPLLDEFSLYLPVWKRQDLSLGAFLRNPDRGWGVFYNLDRIERVGDSVHWIGRWFRNSEEAVLTEAQYQTGHMVVNIRGNLYDMRLLNDNDSHFYARGKFPKPYQYTPPPLISEDGWQVSTLQKSRIDKKTISKFIDEVVLKEADSIDDPYIHGVLIARSGKLVLEEYFHGFHRNKAHDTRSASKSLTSVLAGAVIHSGVPLSLTSPVFETILGKVASSKAISDPRQQKINLEHLLSMSSGQDCDDGNSSSKGNENIMQSQEKQPDWYRYTMDLDMVREPGVKAVYCTAGMNLVGAVLAAASGQNLETLFLDLIARPLQINHYYLNLSPTGQPYMGGGIYWQPRDFMKLGQVMLNGGTWNGRRIISEDYAQKSISTIYQMNNKGYGYGWWSLQYPYKDRQVTAFFAGGNGGQIVMGIPELELLVAFYAGNYSHKTFRKIQEEFVPKYILPALK